LLDSLFQIIEKKLTKCHKKFIRYRFWTKSILLFSFIIENTWNFHWIFKSLFFIDGVVFKMFIHPFAWFRNNCYVNVLLIFSTKVLLFIKLIIGTYIRIKWIRYDFNVEKRIHIFILSRNTMQLFWFTNSDVISNR
jgi:hypothetical protein